MCGMATSPDPKVLKIQIGIELRRLRENAGRTAAEAAEVLGGAVPKISKIENGKQAATPEEVETLSDFYGAPAKRRKYLTGLATQVPKRSRRQTMYRDAVPDWFQHFLALESDASEIYNYELETVTGLLQTEDYARSTIRNWEPAADPRLIESQVQTRMQRQAILRKPSRLQALDMVVSEAALRRIQGSREIMRAQLHHLLDLSEHPKVELRVMPFEAASRITVLSSFTLFQLAQQELSAVYLEDILGATYLWEPNEYTRYSVVYGRLRAAALPPSESRDLIYKVATSYQ